MQIDFIIQTPKGGLYLSVLPKPTIMAWSRILVFCDSGQGKWCQIKQWLLLRAPQK